MEFLKQIAPWIAAAASGNVPGLVALAAQKVSEAIGQPVKADPKAIAQAVSGVSDPEILLKIKQADNELQAHMADLGYQNAEDVNKTMQSEAAADHWPTYSWRPAVGFAFAFNLVMASLLVVGVFLAQVRAWPGADKAVAALPGTLAALTTICALATPILGIASWFRGKMQAAPEIQTDNRG